MNTINETKMRLADLIETNRALAADLDVCRRIAATTARERDTLQQTVEQLQSRLRELACEGRDSRARDEARSHVTSDDRSLERMRHERELLLRDAVAQRAEGNAAAEHIRALTAQLEDASREREDVSGQLEEALAALNEIRSNLQAQLGLEVPPLGAPDADAEDFWLD